jgi:hypothetical protein
MKRILMIMLASMIALTACTTTSDTASSNKPAGIVSNSYVVKATVQAINYNTRMATFKTENGLVFSRKIAADIKNIYAIKKGDTITARYIESLAVEVRKPGEKKQGLAASDYSYVDVNEAGKKPYKIKVNVMEVKAVVTAINYNKRTITLKSADGTSVSFTVSDTVKRFKEIKKDDVVIVTYTESVAYTLEKK